MEYPSYRSRFFWSIGDRADIDQSVDRLFGSLPLQRGLFASDNLITWNRNLGFLDDLALTDAWAKHAERPHERGILWRTAVLAWAARQALRRDGAFVECGTYRGTTAHILLDALKIERPFFLYDLFETAKVELPDHGAGLEAFVRSRFAAYPNVVVTKGSVPESLANAPEQIAFMHIDMNSAAPEIGALEALFHRMTPGGILVLDDYGQFPYRDQFNVERPWFEARGIPILEIPTGQGIVVA
jgi:hypothetical protein